MVNDTQRLMTEFNELGFSKLDESKIRGKVPQEGHVNGINIEVEIDIEGYPLKQPKIFLVGINGKKDLYKKIPKHWKHLDEIIVGTDLKRSVFIICCLHAWAPRKEYGADFLYQRILKWLELNMKSNWEESEEAIGWRLTPNFSLSRVVLSRNMVDGIKAKEVKVMEVEHNQLIHSSGAKSDISKEVSQFRLSSIDFNRNYFFFPKVINNNALKHTKQLRFDQENQLQVTEFLVIRLPNHFSFKTSYQLLTNVRSNFIDEIREFAKGKKNIPILVFHKGYQGNFEALAYFLNEDYWHGKSDFETYALSIDTVPNRPIGIPYKVGLIGTGSLVSQVARLLADKHTSEIFVYDKGVLTADNLGHHELDARFLGHNKALALAISLNYFRINSNVNHCNDVEELKGKSDILIVTVGDSTEYNRLAFGDLLNYEGIIIWAWVSPHNVLQEIVITQENTGCLNCYYIKEQKDPELIKFNNALKAELEFLPTYTFDMCGQPHTESQWEKNVFFATQILSLIRYYVINHKFKFDYFAYLWRSNDMTPNISMGILQKEKNCFCSGEK